MSIFSSFVTDTLTVPGSEDTITIRKLQPRALQAARDANRERSNYEMRLQRDALGDAEFREWKDSIVKEMAASGRVAAADPLGLYDHATLIEHGVVAWSYDRKVTPDSLADIDEDTAAWLAGAILRLSKPSLFQSEDEQEAARKNA